MQATKLKILIALPFIMALASCGGGGSAATGSDDNVVLGNTGSGSFVLSVSDSVIARNSTRWNDYMSLQLNEALKPLNELEDLIDIRIPIKYDECGRANAFYNSADQSITLCDELVDELYAFFSGREGSDRPAQTANALVFIMFHEIGHALVDVLDLPVFGNTESAADGIAAVLAGETDRAFSAVIGGAYLRDENASYGDEHTNGEDRFGDITCWAIGSDSGLLFNSTLASLVAPFIESNRDCTAEYQDILQSTLNTVPALSLLSVPKITNPVEIAAADPNPPKYDVDTTIATALLTTGSDFWSCSASVRSNRVGYRFFGDTGQYQELKDGSALLNFNYVLSGNSTLTLEYTDITFLEKVSAIRIVNSTTFTAVSDSEGNLNCRYTTS